MFTVSYVLHKKYSTNSIYIEDLSWLCWWVKSEFMIFPIFIGACCVLLLSTRLYKYLLLYLCVPIFSEMVLSQNIILILVTLISSASLLSRSHQHVGEEVTNFKNDYLFSKQLRKLLSLTLIEQKRKRDGNSIPFMNDSRCFTWSNLLMT